MARSPLSLARIALFAIPVAVALSCGGTAPPAMSTPLASASASAAAGPPTSCDHATALRERANRLVASGELDRALRALDFADGLCPASASASGKLRDATRVALRPAVTAPADARRAAAALSENAAIASGRGDHAGANALFLQAWRAAHPDGRALANAGIEAIAAGDATAGHALVARGLAELELDPSAHVAVHALDDPYKPTDWHLSADGRFAAQSDAGALVVYDRRLSRRTLALATGLDPARKLSAFQLSPDGSRVATSDGSVVAIWDSFSGDRTATLKSRGDLVYWLPDGRSVYVARSDSTPSYGIDVALADGTGEPRSARQMGASLVTYAVSPDRIVAIDHTTATIFSRNVVHRLKPQPATLRALGGVDMPSTGTDAMTEDAYFARTTTLADGKTTSRKLAVARCETIVMEIPCFGECGAGSRTTYKQCSTLVRATLRRDGARVAIVKSAIPDGDVVEAPTTMGPRPGGDLDLGRPGRAPPKATSQVFDTQTGAVVASLDETTAPQAAPPDPPPPKPVRLVSAVDVAVSPDGATLAIGLAQGDARLVDVATGAVRSLAHKWSNSVVAFTPDGHGIVVASKDGMVVRYATDCASPCAETWRFASVDGHFFSAVDEMAFSPDGRVLAVGTKSQEIFLVDADTGVFRRTIRAQTHYDGNSLAFTPDGSLVVAQGSKIEVRALDGTLQRTLDGVNEEIERLAVTRDGKRLVTIGASRLAQWDLVAGTLERKVELASVSARHLAISPDGTTACAVVYDPAATSGHGRIGCWLLATGEATTNLGASPGRFTFSSDGSLLYAVEGGAVVVRRLATGAEVARLVVAEGADAMFVREPSGLIEALGSLGETVASCSVGRYLFPYTVCEQRFAVPQLLRKLLRGEPLEP